MIDIDELAWEKMDGLLPAIVQDLGSRQVLMVGYMDRAALEETIASGRVTFFSRSKNRLWTKGETSGNILEYVSVIADCDGDALLLFARPQGPTCHLGTTSCFGDADGNASAFLSELEAIQGERSAADPASSYTARLLSEGIKRIAQKVGEEGIETALAAVCGSKEDVESEAADLLYHLLLLLRATGTSLGSVAAELERRHRDSKSTAAS